MDPHRPARPGGIVAYIATDRLDNAMAALGRLGETAASLATAADRGRVVAELRSIGLHQY